MDIFSWFKPKNKKSYALPVEEATPYTGIALIKEFSTVDEPKCADFPRDNYTVYWETFLSNTPAGYRAVLVFNGYDGVKKEEHGFTDKQLMAVRKSVTDTILSTMKKYKRG